MFHIRIDLLRVRKHLAVTGCIRPTHLSRLNANDAGGQYDSSGGAGGKGNPQGSVCLGCVFSFLVCLFLLLTCLSSRYNHYVELVEPAGNRACIKCCDDPADCPTNKGAATCIFSRNFNDDLKPPIDTQGCPNVIKGNYFNCN